MLFRSEGLPIGWRSNQSKMYLKDQAKPKKEPKASKPAAKRFTTQACINWGRRKGWKLVAREAYDYRTKRHHDTLLGSDAVFDTPNGMVAVQGAGRSERAVHMERFNERGGVSAAARMRIGFVYVEFVRGKDEPVVEEWWAES